MRIRHGARSGRRWFGSVASMLGVAIMVSGMVGLTGATPLSAHQAPARLPVLRLDWGGPAQIGLDNAAGGVGYGFLVVNASLVRILPSGKVVGDLATYTISPNHLVYTFTIRPNARFSNAHFVTAHDAEFSLKRDIAPTYQGVFGLPYYGLIEGAAAFHAGTTQRLSGVTVVSSWVLRITITRPATYFLAALSFFSTVLDPTVVAGQTLGLAPDFNDNYLTNTCTGNQGAGPFMFVCHNRSSTLHSFYAGITPVFTLVPNPYYYGHKPHITLELPYLTDSYKAYLRSKVDVTRGLSASARVRWRGSSEFHEFPTGIIYFYTPNVHMAPFNNLHCRLAAAYSLDRRTIIDRVLRAGEHSTYAIVPRGMLGYYAGNDNPHYSLRRARTEFAKCPNRTTLLTLTNPPWGSPSVANVVIRNLAAAGFNVKLNVVSGSDYETIINLHLDTTKTQLILDAWAQDYPDPQDFCSLLRHSGAQFNLGGWSNATYDRLVDRADSTLNPTTRAALYIRAQHLALSQGAFISLSNALSSELVKPYVHGFVFSEAGGIGSGGAAPRNGDWANVWVSPH